MGGVRGQADEGKAGLRGAEAAGRRVDERVVLKPAEFRHPARRSAPGEVVSAAGARLLGRQGEPHWSQ